VLPTAELPRRCWPGAAELPRGLCDLADRVALTWLVREMPLRTRSGLKLVAEAETDGLDVVESIPGPAGRPGQERAAPAPRALAGDLHPIGRVGVRV